VAEVSVTEALELIAEATPLDAAHLEERAASFANRTFDPDSESFALTMALRCTDLTSLEADDTPEKVALMCARAVRPDPTDPAVPSVAAVCIYPAFVPTAVRSLKGTHVQVAGVAGGFPSGKVPTPTKLREIRELVGMGADEVDMALNRAAFLAGRHRETFEEIAASKEICGDARLKVILETGELGSYDQIRRASLLVIAAGADFIKTSTGKIAPGATLQAALCIMETIRDLHGRLGRRVGIKVSGGIRKADVARRYLLMADETLGREWATPDLFRIGASSLVDDLLAHLREVRQADGAD
jgi:deoxyribose-phosphate aldolase